ncbi:MAG: nucleotide exchange factor GrpE [Phycisphaerae bacterium]
MTEEHKPTHKEKKEAKALTKELEELKVQLEKTKAQGEDCLDKLQRISADYANYQKRSAKQIAEAIAYEKEKIIKSLLPVLDNFERTFSHAESIMNVEAMAQGVRMIYDQMLDTLKSHQAQQIDTADKQFDPSIHEAMLQRTEPSKEDGIILEEFQKGYMLNGRIIRPSKVVVNKLPAEPQENPQEPIDETTDTE